jgi:hypothetical protein
MQEIERIHADARALLVAGLREVGKEFWADAVQAASIVDDGTTLTITPAPATPFDAQLLKAFDSQEVFRRAAFYRDVRIEGAAPIGKPAAAVPAETAPPRPPITQADFDEEYKRPRSIAESVTCRRCVERLSATRRGRSRANARAGRRAKASNRSRVTSPRWRQG